MARDCTRVLEAQLFFRARQLVKVTACIALRRTLLLQLSAAGCLGTVHARAVCNRRAEREPPSCLARSLRYLHPRRSDRGHTAPVGTREPSSALLIGAEPGAVCNIADDLCRTHPVFDFQCYQGRATAYVVDTARTVLHCFYEHDDLERTLIATVNRGDDADTTGALAGMLAGARFGQAAIPRAWLTRLDPNVCSRIQKQVPQLLALAPLHTS